MRSSTPGSQALFRCLCSGPLPLGLILFGTASVELADGGKSTNLTARGIAAVGGEEQVGVVVLEPTGNDILLGMAFLRLFRKALFVSEKTVLLVPENSNPAPRTKKPRQSRTTKVKGSPSA